MNQHRYPLAPLLEATGLTEAELGRKIGLRGTPLIRARERGFVEEAADRWACRAGFVPWHIWPEWLDHVTADVSIPCAECGTLFVTFRRGHRYCCTPCQQRAGKRDRYATDAEYRDARRHSAAAYYAENGDYVRKRERRLYDPARGRERAHAYYEANRDAILSRRRARYHAKKAAA